MTISYTTRCGRCGDPGMIQVEDGAGPFTIWRDRGWAVNVPGVGMVCPECGPVVACTLCRAVHWGPVPPDWEQASAQTPHVVVCRACLPVVITPAMNAVARAVQDSLRAGRGR